MGAGVHVKRHRLLWPEKAWPSLIRNRARAPVLFSDGCRVAVYCEAKVDRSLLVQNFSLLLEEMMISRTWSRKSIAFCIAVAVLSVYSMVALASPGQKGPSGELSVSGQVTVNGQAAISGATVFSDSVIATAANSSATVSLGKLGRIELLPSSSLKLSFTDSGIAALLDAGRVRVSTPAGVAATVTTKDGSAVADMAQAAAFTVDVECGNTI